MEHQPPPRNEGIFRVILDRLQDVDFMPGLLATNMSPAIPREQTQTTIHTLLAYTDAIQRKLLFVDEEHPERALSDEARSRLIRQQQQVHQEINLFRAMRERLHIMEQMYLLTDGVVTPHQVQVCIDGSQLISNGDKAGALRILAESFDYTLQSTDDLGYATEVMAYRERQAATEVAEFDDELRSDIANTLLALFHNTYEGTEHYDAICFTVRRIRSLVWQGVRSSDTLSSFVHLFDHQTRALGISEEQVQNCIQVVLTPPGEDPVTGSYGEIA